MRSNIWNKQNQEQKNENTKKWQFFFVVNKFWRNPSQLHWQQKQISQILEDALDLFDNRYGKAMKAKQSTEEEIFDKIIDFSVENPFLSSEQKKAVMPALWNFTGKMNLVLRCLERQDKHQQVATFQNLLNEKKRRQCMCSLCSNISTVFLLQQIKFST